MTYLDDAYSEARKLGEKTLQKAAAEGKDPYLPVLDDILAGEGSPSGKSALTQIRIGHVEIPAGLIEGTKTAGRTNAFARDFMPVLDSDTEFAHKWQRLYDAQLDEGIRDPVKVYEYMWRYYVAEGNKRVSVLKFLDAPLISSDVTRLMPPRSEDRTVRAYYEYTEFYKHVPIPDLIFTEPGRYGACAEIFGESLDAPWRTEHADALKKAFRTFARLFSEEVGKKRKSPVSVSDAFFTYLSLYPPESLTEGGYTEIRVNIRSIWSEFVAGAYGSGQIITADPEEVEKKPKEGPIKSGIGSIRSLLASPKYSAEHPLRIAFLHEKNAASSSWVYGHELGRNHLEDVFPGIVETVMFDDCADPLKLKKAVEAAEADDDEMVIATSPAFLPEIRKLAVLHPGMKFLNCSLNLPYKAVRTYSGRMYEAKFLMGCVAASQAENHRIGYIANAPILGTIADINAFAIGAALVDPSASVYLSWESQKDTDWRKWMYEQGIGVFSGPDLIRPKETSREYGVYLYDEKGEIVNLAMPVWNWGRYYERIVRSVFDGSWDGGVLAKSEQAMTCFWGMSAGVIDVILGGHISYYTKKMVQIFKDALVNGTFTPFDGELRSGSGIIKTADSPPLSYEEIIDMNWLNDNVVGRIPGIDEIEGDEQKAVKVSGVQP